MNTRDRIMEWLLSHFDKTLDALSFGRWSKSQGEQRPAMITFSKLPGASIDEQICMRIAELAIIIASAGFIGLMLAKVM